MHSGRLLSASATVAKGRPALSTAATAVRGLDGVSVFGLAPRRKLALDGANATPSTALTIVVARGPWSATARRAVSLGTRRGPPKVAISWTLLVEDGRVSLRHVSYKADVRYAPLLSTVRVDGTGSAARRVRVRSTPTSLAQLQQRTRAVLSPPPCSLSCVEVV